MESDQVIRISLFWLFIGSIIMVLLGMLGGILANQIWPPKAALQPEKSEQIVSNIKEITISPNQSYIELLAHANRSVVSLSIAPKNNQVIKQFATATVVTNDGLLVTVGTLPKDPLVAADFNGQVIPVEQVGEDKLFGLSFLRLRDGLLSPLDVRPDQIPVASNLITVSRSSVTQLPASHELQINETILPPQIGPTGIQQLFKSTPLPNSALIGSPIIDENGKVAGLVYKPEAGLLIPSNHLLESIQRVAHSKREFNPFIELGFTVSYNYNIISPEKGRQFTATVTTVTANSRAAEAKLQKGDIITHLNDQPLDWQRSFLGQLSDNKTISFTIQRDGKQLTLSIAD